MRAFLSTKWFFLIALVLVTGFVYSPGLSGAFLFDDTPNILENPALRFFNGSVSSLISASLNSTASPLGRPLSMASFALNLHFFGDAPFSFKIVNLCIHLANGVLVFILVQQLWPRFFGEHKASIASGWVTAVWLLHPINLTPVLFVVQRMTSLAAFFTFATLILYLHGRKTAGRKGYMLIAAALLICWPAAIASKETGLLLPLFILLCEWLVLDSFRSLSRNQCWLGILIAGVLAATITAWNWNLVVGGYAYRDFNLLERLLTESRALWFYVLQLLLPLPDFFGLHHDDFAISRGLFSPPQTLLAIGGWMVVIAFVIYSHKRRPLLTFAFLWFMAAHVLESSIVALDIMYEHRNYVATLGILMWLAGLLFAPLPTQQGNRPRLVLAVSFVILCTFITAMRAMQWGDEYHRAQAEAVAHPNSPRANYEAALAVMRQTFLSPAGGSAMAYRLSQFQFRRAAELDPNSKAPFIGLLYLDCVAQYPKDVALQAKLRERFAEKRFAAGDTILIQSLSAMLIENRLCLDDAEVDRLLQAALSNPAAVGAVRGMIYAVAMDYAAAKIHSLPLALTYAKAAVKSDPLSVPLRVNLVHLLLAFGDIKASRQEYAALAGLPISSRDKAEVDALTLTFISMEKNAEKH